MGRFIDEKTRDTWMQLAYASSMGLAVAFAIIIGAGAGYLLDKWLDTFPWCSLVGLIMGIIAGFQNIFIIYQRINRKTKDIESKDKEDK